RDAQVDRIRQLEQARIEFSRQTEQARLVEEKRALEERRVAEKEALQRRYRLCLANAEENYSLNWAEQCKKNAAKNQADRIDCFAKDLLSPSTKTLATSIDERESQELIIALVGPVGSGVSTSAKLLTELLSTDFSYIVPPPFKQSDIIASEARRVGMSQIPRAPLNVYVDQMQTAGNKLREKFGSDYLAEKTIEQIVKFRTAKGAIQNGKAMPGRRAYIIDSLKNVEELNLLRKVYRETLCVFGVFAPDEIRQQRLVNAGAKVSDVTKVIDRDLGEAGTFGQMTRKVFSLSDFFVCNDQKEEELRRKLKRFLQIIFD
ncbi:hypothetical protein C7212DRAFT_349029, partial [Tuber magnatum]